jgi:hypothetical protein
VLARGGHRRIKGATVFVDGVPVADTDDNGEFVVMAAPGRHHVAGGRVALPGGGRFRRGTRDGVEGEIRAVAGRPGLRDGRRDEIGDAGRARRRRGWRGPRRERAAIRFA